MPCMQCCTMRACKCGNFLCYCSAMPLETFFVLSIGNKQPYVIFQVHKRSILDSRKAPSFTVKEGAFGSKTVSIQVARVARHNSYTQPHKDFRLGGRCQSVTRSVLLKINMRLRGPPIRGRGKNDCLKVCLKDKATKKTLAYKDTIPGRILIFMRKTLADTRWTNFVSCEENHYDAEHTT